MADNHETDPVEPSGAEFIPPTVEVWASPAPQPPSGHVEVTLDVPDGVTVPTETVTVSGAEDTATTTPVVPDGDIAGPASDTPDTGTDPYEGGSPQTDTGAGPHLPDTGDSSADSGPPPSQPAAPYVPADPYAEARRIADRDPFARTSPATPPHSPADAAPAGRDTSTATHDHSSGGSATSSNQPTGQAHGSGDPDARSDSTKTDAADAADPRKRPGAASDDPVTKAADAKKDRKSARDKLTQGLRDKSADAKNQLAEKATQAAVAATLSPAAAKALKITGGDKILARVAVPAAVAMAAFPLLIVLSIAVALITAVAALGEDDPFPLPPVPSRMEVTINGEESTADMLLPPAPVTQADLDENAELVEKENPGRWSDVVYEAQTTTRSGSFGVPWTLLAGLARAQSDFGRRSPYDTVDRDPMRDPMYGSPVGAVGSSGMAMSAAYDGAVLVAGDEVASEIGQRLGGKVPNEIQQVGGTGATPADIVSQLPADMDRIDVVVVAFNPPQGRTSAETGADIDRFMRKVGDGVTVHWALGHDEAHPNATSAYNDAVRDAKRHHDNLKVLTWDTDGSLAADGGLTVVGYNALTRQVTAVVETAVASGGWVLPVPKESFAAGGSWFNKYNCDYWSATGCKHTGQDFRSPEGTPIFAAADGRVTKVVELTTSYGKHVVIQHEGGVETLYAHMRDTPMVTLGQAVRAGQQIGWVGETGNTSGAHLHFEARAEGTWTDPLKYLPMQGVQVANFLEQVTGDDTHDHAHDEYTDGSEHYDAVWGPGLYADAADCAVPAVKPAIGGKSRRQGGGPFLLRPEHLDAMTEAGMDPQSPCDQAEYVAEQLDRVGEKLIFDSDFHKWETDDKVAKKLWATVIADARLFVDPVTGKTTCAPDFPISSTNAAYALRSTIICEAQSRDSIQTAVAAATGKGGKVSFETLEGLDAAEQLATEAVDIAYAFSKLDVDRCRPARDYDGVFPLTKAEAETLGVTDRCDTKSVIAAVAKALVSGEAAKLSSRPTAQGAYQPMVGGWSQFSYALAGTQATFSRQGPPQPWQPTAACTTGIDTWVTQATDTHATALDAIGADGTVTDAEQTRIGKLLAATTPNPRQSLCVGATDAEFHQQVALSAESLTEIAEHPAYGGEPPAEGDYATEPTGPAGDESSGAYDPFAPLDELAPVPDAGEVPPAAAPADTPLPGSVGDPVRASRFWAIAGYASEQSLAARPPAAVPGSDPMVSRLTVDGRSVPVADDRGLSAVGVSSFPIADVAIEYAIGYGGIRPKWDTADESVLGANSLTNNVSFTAGGKVGVVIAAAKSQLGMPYSWGGGGPNGPGKGFCDGTNGYLNGACSASSTVGFDCSGLMDYAFSQAGYSIGGTSNEQKTKGSAVTGGLKNALPGDLLFWGSPTTYHVALYLGDNKMIEAPRTGLNVRITDVTPGVTYIRRVVPPEAAGNAVVAFPDTADGQALRQLLPADGKPYAELFVSAGRSHNLHPAILAGVATQESGFSADVISCARSSSVGAQGMMQFMPATAAGFGIDPCDPVQAVNASAKYLRSMLNQFGSLELALAGYNAGPGNVQKYGGVPPFEETQAYVVKVEQYCRTYGGCQTGAGVASAASPAKGRRS